MSLSVRSSVVRREEPPPPYSEEDPLQSPPENTLQVAANEPDPGPLPASPSHTEPPVYFPALEADSDEQPPGLHEGEPSSGELEVVAERSLPAIPSVADAYLST